MPEALSSSADIMTVYYRIFMSCLQAKTLIFSHCLLLSPASIHLSQDTVFIFQSPQYFVSSIPPAQFRRQPRKAFPASPNSLGEALPTTHAVRRQLPKSFPAFPNSLGEALPRYLRSSQAAAGFPKLPCGDDIKKEGQPCGCPSWGIMLFSGSGGEDHSSSSFFLRPVSMTIRPARARPLRPAHTGMFDSSPVSGGP